MFLKGLGHLAFVSIVALLLNLGVSGNPDHQPLRSNRERITLLWRLKVGREELEQPCCSPDGTIYVACNAHGLLALSPQGKVKWRIGHFWDFPTAPTLTPSGDVLAWTDVGLTCFSPTGKLEWVCRALGSSGIDSRGSRPTIAPSGDIIEGNSVGYLFKIGLNGKLKWKLHTSGASDVAFSPKIGRSGLIYFAPGDNNLYAVSPKRAILWKFRTSSSINHSPSVDGHGDALISAKDGSLTAVSPEGHELWRIQFMNPVACSEYCKRTQCFYVSDGYGRVISVSEHGKVNWATQVGNSRWYGNHPAWPPLSTATIPSSPTIDRKGNIYFKSPDGSIHAVSPAGKFIWGFKCLVPLASPITLCGNGTFYAGTGGSHHDPSYIYCFKQTR